MVAIALFCTQVQAHDRKTRVRLTNERNRASILLWEAAPPGIEEFIPKGIVTKLADRLANLRRASASAEAGNGSLLKMYRKEAEAFKVAHYTSGIAGSMWIEFDALTGLG